MKKNITTDRYQEVIKQASIADTPDLINEVKEKSKWKVRLWVGLGTLLILGITFCLLAFITFGLNLWVEQLRILF